MTTSPDANTSNKRRKTGCAEPDSHDPTRWRTLPEQHTYSSKLAHALSRLSRPDSTGRAVRDAADRVLAASARGRTRWSRAMLAGRLSRRLAQINRTHKKAASASSKSKPALHKKKGRNKQQKQQLPALHRKVRVLGRLVPGCRKLSLPNLLEETTDYIAALEMQVKAMTFLTALLNNGGPDRASSS